MPNGLGPDVIPGEPDPDEVARLKALWDADRAARAARTAQGAAGVAEAEAEYTAAEMLGGGSLGAGAGTVVGTLVDKGITAAGGTPVQAVTGGVLTAGATGA